MVLNASEDPWNDAVNQAFMAGSTPAGSDQGEVCDMIYFYIIGLLILLNIMSIAMLILAYELWRISKRRLSDGSEKEEY